MPDLKEAKALGLKRYTAGKACRKHGHTERYTSNQNCCACTLKAEKVWRAAHPGFKTEYMTSWRSENPELIRNAALKTAFGIGVLEYEQMHTAQRGLCACCHQPETVTGGHRSPSPKRLAVDHNHTTDKVRALLCNNCNRAIGLMRECPTTLRSAATYIELHNGVTS